ncbi:hypothetical protein, partial [Martelella mangrovi]|uniref:Uncharacterized protein n=1 Tax=Martelella mangrovi TaxID=1397477 RepID=A0ABV2IGZ9_9HYPH
MLGNGNIGFDAAFEGEGARRFLDELVKARKALYIKVSDVTETIRLPVSGSTIAAQKMASFCLTDASVSAPIDGVRPSRPRGMDWHAFETFRDLGEWGDRPPHNKAGAVYRIALARAYAGSCSRATVNEKAIKRFAEEWNVSLADEGEDAETLGRLTMDETAYYTGGALTEAQICDFAEAAFGPDGEAGLDFLKLKQ